MCIQNFLLDPPLTRHISNVDSIEIIALLCLGKMVKVFDSASSSPPPAQRTWEILDSPLYGPDCWPKSSVHLTNSFWVPSWSSGDPCRKLILAIPWKLPYISVHPEIATRESSETDFIQILTQTITRFLLREKVTHLFENYSLKPQHSYRQGSPFTSNEYQ